MDNQEKDNIYLEGIIDPYAARNKCFIRDENSFSFLHELTDGETIEIKHESKGEDQWIQEKVRTEERSTDTYTADKTGERTEKQISTVWIFEGLEEPIIIEPGTHARIRILK